MALDMTLASNSPIHERGAAKLDHYGRMLAPMPRGSAIFTPSLTRADSPRSSPLTMSWRSADASSCFSIGSPSEALRTRRLILCQRRKRDGHRVEAPLFKARGSEHLALLENNAAVVFQRYRRQFFDARRQPFEAAHTDVLTGTGYSFESRSRCLRGVTPESARTKRTEKRRGDAFSSHTPRCERPHSHALHYQFPDIYLPTSLHGTSRSTVCN